MDSSWMNPRAYPSWVPCNTRDMTLPRRVFPVYFFRITTEKGSGFGEVSSRHVSIDASLSIFFFSLLAYEGVSCFGLFQYRDRAQWGQEVWCAYSSRIICRRRCLVDLPARVVGEELLIVRMNGSFCFLSSTRRNGWRPRYRAVRRRIVLYGGVFI